jgi:hypothetical protein
MHCGCCKSLQCAVAESRRAYSRPLLHHSLLSFPSWERLDMNGGSRYDSSLAEVM